MNVWFAVPSKRPLMEAERALSRWRLAGYKIALLRDRGDAPHPEASLLVVVDTYPGYSPSVNRLVKAILETDSDASFIVTGGDDTFPDPNHAPEAIAQECTEHFGGTFGVMQPIGDPFAGYSIERIAGSPWMGREFCERINQGSGPMWPEYYHMYNDEELLNVATKHGVYWMRPDLTHYHEHWSRHGDVALPRQAPTFLKYANSRENWDRMRAIYETRKAADFPGSAPLPKAE